MGNCFFGLLFIGLGRGFVLALLMVLGCVGCGFVVMWVWLGVGVVRRFFFWCVGVGVWKLFCWRVIRWGGVGGWWGWMMVAFGVLGGGGWWGRRFGQRMDVLWCGWCSGWWGCVGGRFCVGDGLGRDVYCG